MQSENVSFNKIIFIFRTQKKTKCDTDKNDANFKF